ncbi:sugar ABC transporter ATP-binding protein [Nocardia noduli]|uniref:sugar ABC transporter ATP-binding protein n=1 Tax=Nocardia noduli TaxID=2815722 RepID=UPI001C248085|nr:sugar ABC transporter ATP-binding protein [Nocardia noduli]
MAGPVKDETMTYDLAAPVGLSGDEQSFALEMTGIVKSFGGARALDGVDFRVGRGVVHALLGMNGAGKSTLIRVLSGAIAPDVGVIRISGKQVSHGGPRAARAAGIATVYQKRTLVPSLSVAENLQLGRLPRRRGVVSWSEVTATARRMLDDLELDIDPHVTVDTLGPGQQTLVEIARETHQGGRVLVLDEPTATLGGHDAALIHRLVRGLTDRMSIVYISHHLDEVMRVSDHVTALRDGRVVLSAPTGELTSGEIVEAMVGTAVVNERPARELRAHEPVLAIRGLARPGRLKALDITVGAGEVVAILGPAGDGQEELFPFLSGLRGGYSGSVTLADRTIRPDRVAETLRSGLRCVTGDRLGQGLVPELSVGENITALDPTARRPIINWTRLRQRAADARERFGVVSLHSDPAVVSLSGGNQQKVLLAKWLSGTDLTACLLEEPTAGVDVSAKSEIHTLVDDLARRDIAILIASSDIDEVLRLADRILVIRQGHFVAEVRAETITHSELTHLLLGGTR